MLPFALNQMTSPNVSTLGLFDMVKSLGFSGIELRNDLIKPIFDDITPTKAKSEAAVRGIRILALAEVYAFNDNTPHSRTQILELAKLAQECGAEAIVLIPRVSDQPMDRATQRNQLQTTLSAVQYLLEDYGITALIEPLGFANSTLRLKADAVAVLEDLGQPACFALIHDTFHHALANETEVFASATRIVHVSGVQKQNVLPNQFLDEHRGLVDENDRLGNLEQIKTLLSNGYKGPISFEAFSKDIHELDDPTPSLSASAAFINSHVTQIAA